MLTRVSSIESFRRWRLDEEQSVDDLVHWMTTDEPSEAMLAGTAFHKALEDAPEGDFVALSANGYEFIMPDAEIALPSIRELRAFGNYGPLRVTGQVDAIDGNRIEDHKTTASFRPDGYLEGFQWRFYLDLFGADVFRWNVFEIVPDRKVPKTYHVKPPQLLEQYRYPGLHDDCMDLAADFYEFASAHMPGYSLKLEAA